MPPPEHESGPSTDPSPGRPSPGPAPTSGTLQDPLAEALRVIELAGRSGVVVRLMGGLSFHARVPTWTARVDRERRDIDLATRSRDRTALRDLLVREGYEPDKAYNALYGHKQLYFVDLAHQRPVDVLVDRLEMCHRFDFGDRLTVDAPTMPLAEMLLSKLQIARINRKDILDALALLASYPLNDGDDGTINLTRIVGLTSGDWGWWRTVTGNLDKLRLFHATELQPGELEFGAPAPYAIPDQLTRLREAIDAAPKSTRWRLRAQVGDRVKWFEEPEEVGHDR